MSKTAVITNRYSDIPHDLDVENPSDMAYWAGVSAGMQRFAWWKDGVMYVGTSGTTLKEARRDMDKEANVQCPHPSFRIEFRDDDSEVYYCTRCGVEKA